jgi:L-lactate dehydrogenase complex protein LldG
MTDGDKQAILQSIRENLATAQPAGHEAAPAIASLPAVIDRESLLRQFTDELAALGADVFLARTVDGAQGYIRNVVKRHQAQRIAISAAPILKSLAVESLLNEGGAEVISLPDGSQPDGLEKYKHRLMTADLGITGADIGLADSGTLVLQTRETEGRLASLLPPVHLAVIKADQLLPSVIELITQFELPPLSSGVIFITGPSRTADIELTLTVGVHGPKELHVLVLE